MERKNQQQRGGGQQRGRKPRYGQRQESEFDSKLLDLARVTRVVAGGRRFSFRALVGVGDKKGRIGVGLAKGSDVSIAIDKASRQGQKKMVTVPLKDGTITRETGAKFKAAKVYLWPRKSGLMIGGVLRQLAKLAGIDGITGKIRGSSNKVANARAFIIAIEKLHSNANTRITSKEDKK